MHTRVHWVPSGEVTQIRLPCLSHCAAASGSLRSKGHASGFLRAAFIAALVCVAHSFVGQFAQGAEDARGS